MKILSLYNEPLFDTHVSNGATNDESRPHTYVCTKTRLMEAIPSCNVEEHDLAATLPMGFADFCEMVE